MARNCLFCGVEISGQRSKEHIIPQWLLEYLQVSADELIQYSHVQPFGGTISRRRQGGRTLVHGGVCTGCNSGWMSELEEIKPLFIAMNEGRPLWLFGSALKLLSTWAFKTAILFNMASNYRKLFPVDMFTYLYEHRCPAPSCSVDVALTTVAPGKHLQTRQANVQMFLFTPGTEDKKKLAMEARNASAVVTFRFGMTFWQVVRVPSINWERLPDRPSGVMPIYPDAELGMQWPSATLYEENIDVLNISPSMRFIPRVLRL